LDVQGVAALRKLLSSLKPAIHRAEVQDLWLISRFYQRWYRDFQAIDFLGS